MTTPNHLYFDNCAYFITAATYKHHKLLVPAVKEKLRQLLHEVFDEYGWTLDHWVILDNHYHLLANSRTGRDISKILNKIHNQSAQWVNKLLPDRAGGKVWCNYWDYCPRDERDYNIRLCYLLNNPVKHGYVGSLHDWPWSDFAQAHQRMGDAGLRRLFRKHGEYRTLVLPEDEF